MHDTNLCLFCTTFTCAYRAASSLRMSVHSFMLKQLYADIVYHSWIHETSAGLLRVSSRYSRSFAPLFRTTCRCQMPLRSWCARTNTGNADYGCPDTGISWLNGVSASIACACVCVSRHALLSLLVLALARSHKRVVALCERPLSSMVSGQIVP